MERRRFVTACAAVAAAGLGAATGSWAGTEPRLYTRTQLLDIHGDPIRVRALATLTNYVFNYPFVATPCFLLDLGRPVVATALRASAGSA